MIYNLSTEQVKKYNEEGYVIIDNVIDKGLLDRVKLASDKIVDKASLINKSNDQYDLAENHSKNKPSVRRVKQPQSFF